MRITYRGKGNKEYWEKRWRDLPVDASDGNVETYPLKYAIKAVDMALAGGGKGRLLDAGCGAGRVIRYFHTRGFECEGFDFIGEVVEKLKRTDPTLAVETGDVTSLHYEDGRFACCMGFGLYHNLPPELQDKGFGETRRVLSPGGVLCASFRADNLTTRVSDWLRGREQPRREEGRQFHKINFTAAELRARVERNGFRVLDLEYVENMPVLYKFALCRHATHRVFDEKRGRREGYRLNWAAGAAQTVFSMLLPAQACNVFVVFAKAV